MNATEIRPSKYAAIGFAVDSAVWAILSPGCVVVFRVVAVSLAVRIVQRHYFPRTGPPSTIFASVHKRIVSTSRFSRCANVPTPIGGYHISRLAANQLATGARVALTPHGEDRGDRDGAAVSAVLGWFAPGSCSASQKPPAS